MRPMTKPSYGALTSTRSPSSIHLPSTRKPWVVTSATVICAMCSAGPPPRGTLLSIIGSARIRLLAFRDNIPFQRRGYLNTILELGEALRLRKISPVELTRDCLARIEKLNPALNAFITVTTESALKQAQLAEDEIEHGNWRGPLHGIPIGLKDLIDTAGVATTTASELDKGRVPNHSTIVARKLEGGGAILLGKQNLHK